MKGALRIGRGRWRFALATGLIAAGIAVLADRQGLLQRPELLAYDALLRRARHAGTAAQDIVILAIDDRTFQGVREDKQYAFNYGTWPYSRNLWARIVEYLSQVGARAIVFDVVMDERDTDPSNDEAFRDEVAETGLPVYVGFAVRPLGRDEKRAQQLGRPTLALPRVDAKNRLAVVAARGKPDSGVDPLGADEVPALGPREVAEALAFPVSVQGIDLPRLADAVSGEPAYPIWPIPQLISTLPGFGLVLPEEDEDGTLRRTHFAYSDKEGNAYVTLAVSAAADFLDATRIELSPGQLKIGDRAIRINRDGTAETDFGGKFLDRFHAYSLLSVMDDWVRLHAQVPLALPPETFKDKIVLVAGFAVGTYDEKATPFESRAPGAVKQASELEALLHGSFITRAPAWVGIAFPLLVALACALVVLSLRSVWWQLLWLPLSGVLVVGISAWALRLGIHPPTASPLLAAVLASAGALGTNFLFADRERLRMQVMFSRYVSKLVVDQLAAQPELPKLDGENREVTAFFSDIRKFSTFSEKLKDDPKTLVRLLNEYLTRVSAALLRHGACLDKYIGDAVVCIFGAPLAQPDHAVRACRAALEVQQEVTRMRSEFKAQGLPDVYTRIGVNSAVMFVGNFGSEQLFNYTAMGDGMNLASRLEGANKAYDTRILIGPRTRELARDFIEARELDWARVAGKTEAVALYELLALGGQLPGAKRETLRLYGQALEAYRAAHFDRALEALRAALEVDPEDGPSKALATRCRTLLERPPSHFDGIVDLDK